MTDDPVGYVSPFDDTETLIIKRLADGKRIKEIAYEIKIPANTVNYWITLMRHKANTKTLPGLVALCIRRGWIV